MLDILRKARPSWSTRDAAAAHQKLAKVGVTSVSRLADALKGDLNERFREAGMRTFTAETLQALQYQIEAELGLLPLASQRDLAAAKPSPGGVNGGGDLEELAGVLDKQADGDGAAGQPKPRGAAVSAEMSAAAVELQQPAVPTISVAIEDEATGDTEFLGMWLFTHNASMYEIRLASDLGIAAVTQMLSGEAMAGLDENCLFYVQRFANGSVVYGALSAVSPSTGWEWEGRLNHGGALRLRKQGSLLVSRTRPAGKSEWEAEKTAERPNGYAFYDSDNDPNGHRFVHLGWGEGGGDFPVVGLTAGWLPVALIDVPKPDLFAQKRGDVRVRFLGTFCDPFEAASPAALATKIRTVAPRPFGGNPMGQVLLTGDGGVTVQPPARAPPNLGGPFGKGWGKKPGRGSLWPFSLAAKRQGPGVLSRTAPPPLSPSQTVAAAFGCTTSQLRDRALFRGKLRQLPHRRHKLGLEMELPANSYRTSAAGSPKRPLISILCLRWYDYWSDPSPSSDYNILNDGYFTDLFHGPRSMGRLVPGEYEVYTIFVERTKDLLQLNPNHLRAAMKGRNAAAWYFVWPSIEGTGFVREPEFFHFCQNMERVPLRSCWPHETSLYRLLCGKLWIPQMSLNSRYRVPPTVRVQYSEYQRSPRKAALRALESLMRIRSTVWGKAAVSVDSFKGVAKLGFSWCGSDVLPFQGLQSLVVNLGKLFHNEGCENNTCLVQEMVPGVVGEHRILCIHDKAINSFHREALWMENVKESSAQVKHNVNTLDVAEFKMASSINMKAEMVIKHCFDGDRFAMRVAEHDAMQLVDRWLSWYRTESPEPPQCTRIDFLVTHPGPGKAEVWTCEVGECGASLCSVEVHGRNLAAMNSAVLLDPARRFPQRIPSEIPRNNGQKS